MSFAHLNFDFLDSYRRIVEDVLRPSRELAAVVEEMRRRAQILRVAPPIHVRTFPDEMECRKLLTVAFNPAQPRELRFRALVRLSGNEEFLRRCEFWSHVEKSSRQGNIQSALPSASKEAEQQPPKVVRESKPIPDFSILERKRFVTKQEAGNLIGRSRPTVDDWIKKGLLDTNDIDRVLSDSILKHFKPKKS